MRSTLARSQSAVVAAQVPLLPLASGSTQDDVLSCSDLHVSRPIKMKEIPANHADLSQYIES